MVSFPRESMDELFFFFFFYIFIRNDDVTSSRRSVKLSRVNNFATLLISYLGLADGVK